VPLRRFPAGRPPKVKETTMSLHERTLRVIQTFYDAAMDETLWPAALKNLSDLTRSQAASFWVLDGSEQPRLPTFICFNFDMEDIRYYLEHTAHMDPTVQYLVAHPLQPIVHDGLVISEREKDKHPYYDWHNRHIDTRFRMVGQTRLTPTVQAGVALHRRQKAGRYEPKDINRFALLHGHLERALAIAFRLGSLGAMQQLTTEWLDRNAAAVVFLDERKHVVFVNRAAQALQTDGDGIRLRSDGVMLPRKQDNERLQELIAQVLSPIALPGSAPAGGAMRAMRPSGKRPYGILVGPVSQRYPVMSTLRPAVCIVVTDPDRQMPLPCDRLQTAFGLTEAEAKLAALLAAGEGLRIAAEKLEITYGTARTRLAEIFQKTDTRRQGELIRLLLATLAVG
jgi:DNA-binding CsgD family transcriptional regulator